MMKPQVIALLLAGATPAAWSQSADSQLVPPPPKEENKEKPDKPGKPDKEDKNPKAEKPEKPERPEAPKGRENDPLEDIKSDFRSRTDEYLRKHRELLENLKAAKGEDKKKIREQLKDLKEQLKSDQLAAARDLLTDHRDKIDKEKGKGGGGRPRD